MKWSAHFVIVFQPAVLPLSIERVRERRSAQTKQGQVWADKDVYICRNSLLLIWVKTFQSVRWDKMLESANSPWWCKKKKKTSSQFATLNSIFLKTVNGLHFTVLWSCLTIHTLLPRKLVTPFRIFPKDTLTCGQVKDGNQTTDHSLKGQLALPT